MSRWIITYKASNFKELEQDKNWQTFSKEILDECAIDEEHKTLYVRLARQNCYDKLNKLLKNIFASVKPWESESKASVEEFANTNYWDFIRGEAGSKKQSKKKEEGEKEGEKALNEKSAKISSLQDMSGFNAALAQMALSPPINSTFAMPMNIPNVSPFPFLSTIAPDSQKLQKLMNDIMSGTKLDTLAKMVQDSEDRVLQVTFQFGYNILQNLAAQHSAHDEEITSHISNSGPQNESKPTVSKPFTTVTEKKIAIHARKRAPKSDLRPETEEKVKKSKKEQDSDIAQSKQEASDKLLSDVLDWMEKGATWQVIMEYLRDIRQMEIGKICKWHLANKPRLDEHLLKLKDRKGGWKEQKDVKKIFNE